MANTNEYFLNIPQAAKLLHSTPSTVRVWLCKNTVIPKCLIVRLGRKVLFSKRLFEEWIAQNCPFIFEPKENCKRDTETVKEGENDEKLWTKPQKTKRNS